MRIPGEDEIIALHERYAPTPEAFTSVYTHCEIVWRIAEQLLPRARAGIDRDLVRAGCLLHDAGVYRLYDEAGVLDQGGYIRHGVLGHELLREAGYPEAICRFATRHTGVGISRDDVLRQELPIPPADYVAETPEEEIVMYADKFHTKSVPPSFLTAAAYAQRVARFGTAKVAAFTAMRDRFGEPDLAVLSAAYGQSIRDIHVPLTPEPAELPGPCPAAPPAIRASRPTTLSASSSARSGCIPVRTARSTTSRLTATSSAAPNRGVGAAGAAGSPVRLRRRARTQATIRA